MAKLIWSAMQAVLWIGVGFMNHAIGQETPIRHVVFIVKENRSFDHMFGRFQASSLAGASFPNHLYLIASQSGGAIQNPSNIATSPNIWGCDAVSTANVLILEPNGKKYTRFPCFDYATLGDVLDGAKLTWRYYAPSQGQPGYQWSAYDAISHIRNGPDWQTNVMPVSQFIT